MARVPRIVARLFAAGVLLGSLSPERLDAQSVPVNAGVSPTARVFPGAKLTVPVIVDLANAGAVGVASLSVSLSWGSASLSFDSLRAAPGLAWSFMSNTANADGGSVEFVASDASELSGTSAIANLFLTARTLPSGTRITPVVSAAHDAGHQNVLAAIRPRRLDVCIAVFGKWGDATSDNIVNIVDAQQIARHSVGLAVLDAATIAARGDVTNDGAVNIIDAQQVARFSVGLTAAARTGTEAYVQPPTVSASMTPAGEQRIGIGGTVQLTATPFGEAENLTGCEGFIWSSSAPAVATVNSTGFVTGLSAGTALVTATSLSNPAVSASRSVVVADPAVIRLAVSHAGRPASRYIAEVSGGAFTELRGFSVDGIAMNNATFDIPVPSTGVYTIRMIAIDAASTTNLMVVAGGTLTANVTTSGFLLRNLVLSAPAYSVVSVPPITRLGSSVVVSWRVADPAHLIDGTERGVLFCGTIHSNINTFAADFGGTQSDACGVTLTAQGTLTFSNAATPMPPQQVPGILRMQFRATQLVRTGTGAATDVLVHWISPSVTRGESPLSITVPPLTQVEVTPALPVIPAGTTQQFEVVARDANGIITGLPVAWTSSQPSVATVSSTGLVTGVAPGQSSIAATVATLPGSSVVTVTGAVAIGSITVAAPSTLTGNNTATATATVRDLEGNIIPNVAITWTSSDFRVARVSETGTIQALGAGATQISATAAGVTGVAIVNVQPTPPAFRIDLRQRSAMSPAVENAFAAASQRWSQIIRGDVTDVGLANVDVSMCLDQTPGTTVLNEGVDDVIIFATVKAIDGAGGILAEAGPCIVRDGNGPTIVGVMTFDAADIPALEADGTLTDVILHEMGHVLGVGTLWGPLLQNPAPSPGLGDPVFAGVNARWAFSKLGTGYGGAVVPVENCCGDGTRNAHWRESVLQRELMTGFITVGGLNPLSPLTAASLIDIGYVVDVNASDLPPSFLRSNAGGTERARPVAERIHGPRMLLDPSGRGVNGVRAPVVPPAVRRD